MPLHLRLSYTPHLSETASPAPVAIPPHLQWMCGAAWWNERHCGDIWWPGRGREVGVREGNSYYPIINLPSISFPSLFSFHNLSAVFYYSSVEKSVTTLSFISNFSMIKCHTDQIMLHLVADLLADIEGLLVTKKKTWSKAYALSQHRVPPILGFSLPTHKSLEPRIMRKGEMHMRYLSTNPRIV